MVEGAGGSAEREALIVRRMAGLWEARGGNARTGRQPLRSAALAVMVSLPALAVAGCAGMYDPEGFSSAMAPGLGQPQADAALAAIARGDYTRAELQATAALARDPNNPYALLAAGVAYQHSARPELARDMYGRILALRSPAVVSGPWWGDAPRLVSDVAADNMRALGPAVAMVPGMVPGMVPTAMAAADSADMASDQPQAALGDDAASPAAQRFAVLRRLQDDGLITYDEYQRRRAANIGALLPLSEQPPAAGLDRPAPTAEEVVSRLRALRDAFETRNVSAAQHAAERTMILDGLLPADPRTRAMPALPPAGVMEAAAMVGRLQRLREMGLISASEQAREKAAIDKATRPVTAVAPAPALKKAPAPATSKPKPAAATAGVTPLLPAEGTGNPAATLRTGRGPLEVLPTPAPGADEGPGDGAVLAAAQGGTVLQPAAGKPAVAAPQASPQDGKDKDKGKAVEQGGETSGAVSVHLASFRSRDRAEAGWTELRAKYTGLKDLTPRIAEIDLPGQGSFFRLLAGPLPDRAAAEALCKALQAQYCKPAFGTN